MTGYDDIVTVYNSYEYSFAVGHLNDGESILIRDISCSDLGLVMRLDGMSKRLWSCCGCDSIFSIADSDNNWMSESQFLEYLKDHYPDHFLMFLFHPELLK